VESFHLFVFELISRLNEGNRNRLTTPLNQSLIWFGLFPLAFESLDCLSSIINYLPTQEFEKFSLIQAFFSKIILKVAFFYFI